MTPQACILMLRNMVEATPNVGVIFMKEEIRTHIKHPADSTGDLERSVSGGLIGHLAYVQATAPYAQYFDEGRGDVYPKKAKFLQWYSNERGYVRTYHAGPMTGTHFAKNTADRLAQWVNNYNMYG